MLLKFVEKSICSSLWFLTLVTFYSTTRVPIIILFNGNCYKVLHIFFSQIGKRNKVQLSSKSYLELHLDNQVLIHSKK